MGRSFYKTPHGLHSGTVALLESMPRETSNHAMERTADRCTLHI